MRIEEIELFRVAMPMKEPWRTAFSEEVAIDGVLVRLRMEGVDGWVRRRLTGGRSSPRNGRMGHSP